MGRVNCARFSGNQNTSGQKTARPLGLWLFVAIPLPGTGAWTGSLAAAFLDMRLKNALPAVADTAGILSRERIALLPREAIVVNVGRGSAIDQDALMEALNAGRIAGAALDVVVPEPLPKDHPLWSTRNLLLTPHISGNMSLGYTCDRNLDMFCRDLENYAAGRPLEHRVDRKRGY